MKLLFILARPSIGGTSQAMLHMLQLYKEKGLKFDVFFLSHTGIFLEDFKNVSNVLPESRLLKLLITPKNSSISKYNIADFMVKTFFYFIGKLISIHKRNSFFFWLLGSPITRDYSKLISFQESITAQFVASQSNPAKVCWVHNNYEYIKGECNDSQMHKIFSSFERIICVSEAARDSMIKNLRDLHTFVYLPNTFNSNQIRIKSEALLQNFGESLNIISVGRMAQQKRYDRVISVANMLVKSNVEFVWRIVGGGELYDYIDRLIQQNHLSSKVLLLGNSDNPYPYIKASDIMVITSDYEAQPRVAIEAFILGIPVISTNFASASSVISPGINGDICGFDPKDIFDSIMSLTHSEAIVQAKANLIGYQYDNEEILDRTSRYYGII